VAAKETIRRAVSTFAARACSVDMPNDAPMRYELRIQGHLDQHWSTWFGGLALTREDDGTTTFRGAVTDQAELHGLLTKVRDLGVTLISLMSVDDRDVADSQEQQRR